MIYLARFPGFLKLGYASCASQRLSDGLWDNKHPKELCGKLGPECIEEVIGIWAATKEEEKALHKRLPDSVGEFYEPQHLPEILKALEDFPKADGLPLLRPSKHDKSSNKRACCTGFIHDCAHCGQTFVTGRHWKRHRDHPPQRCTRARTAAAPAEAAEEEVSGGVAAGQSLSAQ